jgi:glutamate/tyrosine decarboxylase-like PLP-dependent enzyme
MTNNLITSDDKKQQYFGTITSGGSESLILALYAYRNYYENRNKPNVVVPVTMHAAIDKGCFYFNI